MRVAATRIVARQINDRGRVVGTFVDLAANLQRVFLYNGTAVSSFGAYPTTDTLHLAMNDRGVILLSDIPENAQVGATYLVTCAGSGC